MELLVCIRQISARLVDAIDYPAERRWRGKVIVVIDGVGLHQQTTGRGSQTFQTIVHCLEGINAAENCGPRREIRLIDGEPPSIQVGVNRRGENIQQSPVIGGHGVDSRRRLSYMRCPYPQIHSIQVVCWKTLEGNALPGGPAMNSANPAHRRIFVGRKVPKIGRRDRGVLQGVFVFLIGVFCATPLERTWVWLKQRRKISF